MKATPISCFPLVGLCTVQFFNELYSFVRGSIFNGLNCFVRGSSFNGLNCFVRRSIFDGLKRFVLGSIFNGLKYFVRGSIFNGLNSFVLGSIFNGLSRILRDMTHSYGTWLIHMGHDSFRAESHFNGTCFNGLNSNPLLGLCVSFVKTTIFQTKIMISYWSLLIHMSFEPQQYSTSCNII